MLFRRKHYICRIRCGRFALGVKQQSARPMNTPPMGDVSEHDSLGDTCTRLRNAVKIGHSSILARVLSTFGAPGINEFDFY